MFYCSIMSILWRLSLREMYTFWFGFRARVFSHCGLNDFFLCIHIIFIKFIELKNFDSGGYHAF